MRKSFGFAVFVLTAIEVLGWCILIFGGYLIYVALGRYDLSSALMGGEDVNAWMVRNGWALNYRQYSTAYLGDEAYAQKNRLNLWSGTFENPWDWRHKR